MTKNFFSINADAQFSIPNSPHPRPRHIRCSEAAHALNINKNSFLMFIFQQNSFYTSKCSVDNFHIVAGKVVRGDGLVSDYVFVVGFENYA